MRPLPRIGRYRRGVFTHDEARRAGWTRDALVRAVARGELIRLRRGIYALTTYGADVSAPRARDIDRARIGIAASLLSPAVAVSHLPAVEVHGWPVWAPRPRTCALVTDDRTRVPGAHVHRTPLSPDEVQEVDGYRVTRPTRTVLDVACEFGTEAGLVVADAAAARGLTSADDLRAAIGSARGRTGIAHARPLSALVDGRAESPLESRSRWQFVGHDLPPPAPQMWVYDLDGRFLGRTDFLWEVGVVGEVDGAAKLEDPEARRELLTRQTALGRSGLRVVRWGARDLDRFGTTAAWLREELGAAVADPRPRRWTASPVRLHR